MSEITVAYANKTHQVELVVDMSIIMAATSNPKSITVREAITHTKLLAIFPEIDLSKQAVGINSRLVALDDDVLAGQRVEVYRPLELNPNEARLRREAKRKALNR